MGVHFIKKKKKKNRLEGYSMIDTGIGTHIGHVVFFLEER